MPRNTGRRHANPEAQSRDAETANPALRAAILEVVDNQLRDNTPPETKETFERLQREGHSVDEAKRLIGVTVMSEIYDVMKSQQPYNQARYVAALKRLPTPPFDESEGE